MSVRRRELQHADALLRRILFLEGAPDVASRAPIKVGKDVVGMLRNDLELEYHVVAELRRVIALCETEGDYVTRDHLQGLLKDTEEDHAYWLEIQLGLIERVGIANYQQSQM